MRFTSFIELGCLLYEKHQSGILSDIVHSAMQGVTTFFPRYDPLLAPIIDHEDLPKLIRFSKGFYTIEKWDDKLVFNDLRFGQIMGWQNPNEKFVFHYFLQDGSDNTLVVQRGRFSKWNMSNLKSLLDRIYGN